MKGTARMIEEEEEDEERHEMEGEDEIRIVGEGKEKWQKGENEREIKEAIKKRDPQRKKEYKKENMDQKEKDVKE